ncbi:MAG: hypothetical protein IJ649_08315 [Oscillospiraceae bacterium]|nr:hypothetical protein [Oscillospiraceae bacterium]
MNDSKICPLLIASASGDVPTECQHDRCAWWIPQIDNGKREDSGRCAMAELAQWARIAKGI